MYRKFKILLFYSSLYLLSADICIENRNIKFFNYLEINKYSDDGYLKKVVEINTTIQLVSLFVQVKQTGIIDTKENCWKFFIERVRRQLRCVLCFSPVGATLRKRARQFPAIVNCTAIDWFQDWPQTALESVSATFLEV